MYGVTHVYPSVAPGVLAADARGVAGISEAPRLPSAPAADERPADESEL
jgi:hypothetical protein